MTHVLKCRDKVRQVSPTALASRQVYNLGGGWVGRSDWREMLTTTTTSTQPSEYKLGYKCILSFFLSF